MAAADPPASALTYSRGMLDHLSIQCGDVAAAKTFYDTVLATVGGKRIMEFGDNFTINGRLETFFAQ